MQEPLVKITKYSNKIKELNICKRVNVDYPLLCRDSVAKRLAEAADRLPENLQIQVDSAYRTKKTQTILWNARKESVPGLVHNPNEGESPHCTGGSVDISFINANGKELNLSEPFEKFYDEPKLISSKISPKAQDLRNIMHNVMLSVGFTPNPREYWHFSYGDKVWADFTNHKPIYEEVALDESLYFPKLKRLFYKFYRMLWKIINNVLSIQTNY